MDACGARTQTVKRRGPASQPEEVHTQEQAQGKGLRVNFYILEGTEDRPVIVEASERPNSEWREATDAEVRAYEDAWDAYYDAGCPEGVSAYDVRLED